MWQHIYKEYLVRLDDDFYQLLRRRRVCAKVIDRRSTRKTKRSSCNPFQLINILSLPNIYAF